MHVLLAARRVPSPRVFDAFLFSRCIPRRRFQAIQEFLDGAVEVHFQIFFVLFLLYLGGFAFDDILPLDESGTKNKFVEFAHVNMAFNGLHCSIGSKNNCGRLCSIEMAIFRRLRWSLLHTCTFGNIILCQWCQWFILFWLEQMMMKWFGIVIYGLQKSFELKTVFGDTFPLFCYDTFSQW